MSRLTRQTMSKLLALIIHDLRNPAAALAINLPYVSEALRSLPDSELSSGSSGASAPSSSSGTSGAPGEPGGRDDLLEALSESQDALADLLRGLERFGWAARWMAGEKAVVARDGDIAAELREFASAEKRMKIELDLPNSALNVRGANALVSMVDILVENASRHAPPGSPVSLCARRAGRGAVVEIRDQGPAVAKDLRRLVFTPEGQAASKGRSDGRYGRVVALLVVNALAQAAGARLEAGEDGGRALFRVRLRGANGSTDKNE